MEFDCPDVHLIVGVYGVAVRLIDIADCFTTEALAVELNKANSGWTEDEIGQALRHLATRGVLVPVETRIADFATDDINPALHHLVETKADWDLIWLSGPAYPRKKDCP